MAVFAENIFVSEFNIMPNKHIGIRKTTEVLRDGEVISQTYWRCVLTPDDPQTADVLGGEPFYFNLALAAWSADA